jgi:hypothetical protein
MLAMPSLPIPTQGNRSMDHPLLLFVNGGLALTHSASMCRGMTACLGAFALRPRSLPWPLASGLYSAPRLQMRLHRRVSENRALLMNQHAHHSQIYV